MYILADNQTKEALAIDPLANKLCLQTATDHGYKITQVLNTHHHHDHIGGNQKVIAATGASLLAHANASIPSVDRALNVGDSVTIGSFELQVLDTPGHTLSHVCLYFPGNSSLGESYTGQDLAAEHSLQPALFSGDTLFNAGVGNCYNGGHPEIMFETISQGFNQLPGNTRLFPGHDYIENNLRFSLDIEPTNLAAKELLQTLQQYGDGENYVTTLKEEQSINVFMRLESTAVRETLLQRGYVCDDNKSTFLALRELRNQW